MIDSDGNVVDGSSPDIGDGTTGTTGNSTAEECAKMIDIVEMYTGMDFGYAEHINCISNSDFIVLGNFISKVREDKFVRALDRVKNPGTNKMITFHSVHIST